MSLSRWERSLVVGVGDPLLSPHGEGGGIGSGDGEAGAAGGERGGSVGAIRTRIVATNSSSATAEEEGVRWLALLLLKAAVILANGVRQRYALSKGERCPRCGHSY